MRMTGGGGRLLEAMGASSGSAGAWATQGRGAHTCIVFVHAYRCSRYGETQMRLGDTAARREAGGKLVGGPPAAARSGKWCARAADKCVSRATEGAAAAAAAAAAARRRRATAGTDGACRLLVPAVPANSCQLSQPARASCSLARSHRQPTCAPRAGRASGGRDSQRPAPCPGDSQQAAGLHQQSIPHRSDSRKTHSCPDAHAQTNARQMASYTDKDAPRRPGAGRGKPRRNEEEEEEKKKRAPTPPSSTSCPGGGSSG